MSGALAQWRAEYRSRCLRALLYTATIHTLICAAVVAVINALPGVITVEHSVPTTWWHVLWSLFVCGACVSVITAALVGTYTLDGRAASAAEAASFGAPAAFPAAATSRLAAPRWGRGVLIYMFVALLTAVVLLPRYAALLLPTANVTGVFLPSSLSSSSSASVVNGSAVFLLCVCVANSCAALTQHARRHAHWLLSPAVSQPLANQLLVDVHVSCRRAWHDSCQLLRWLLPSWWLLGGWLCDWLAGEQATTSAAAGVWKLNRLTDLLWRAAVPSDFVVDSSSFSPPAPLDGTAGVVFVWLPVLALAVGALSSLPTLLAGRLLRSLLTRPLPHVAVRQVTAAVLTDDTAAAGGCTSSGVHRAASLAVPECLDVPCVASGRNASNGECPLLQRLLMRRLCEAVRDQRQQRACVFSLSEPGGHAHTCRHVVRTCIGHVQRLCDVLELAATKSTSSAAATGGQTAGQDSNVSVAGRLNVSAMVGCTQRLQDATLLSTTSKSSSASSVSTSSPSASWSFFAGWLWWLTDGRIGGSGNASATVAAAVACYGDLCACSVQILACLTWAALSEDQYGVMQPYLHQVFVCLLRMRGALELAHGQLESGCAGGWTRGRQIQRVYAVLWQCTMGALHRISAIYRPHLESMRLDGHQRAQLVKLAEHVE